MSDAVTKSQPMTFPEITKISVVGLSGSNVTIKHNLGRTPMAAWAVPKGNASATAIIISMNATDLVVVGAAGYDADFFLVAGSEA